MDKYAVFGNPIGHSRSPFIHRLFAEQTAQQLEYQAIAAPIDGFAASVSAFFADQGQDQGKGANVTVPFKEQAFELCDQLSERASKAAAVNTLIKVGSEIHGDNTDGIGLVNDLLNHKIPLSGSRILLLGAGGAARGVILPLLAQGPTQLVIANRTVEKAQQLVTLFDHSTLASSAFDKLSGQHFDLIINGTSAGLSGNIPALPTDCLSPETTCYDMLYSKTLTPFNQWATTLGVQKTLDGLGMLVEQAAESFALWRGVRPDTQTVLAKLRGAI